MVVKAAARTARSLVRRASRGPQSKSHVAFLVLVALTYHNKRLESKRSYYKDTLHLIHAALYLVRKTCSVAVRRLLGISKHPYWHPFDEIIIQTLRFAALSGHVTAPRLAIDGYQGLQRGMSRVFGHCSVEDVDLGLGQGTGDALWITLDKSHELGSCPVILWFHGGGYCIGSAGMYINAHANWLKQMKERQGMVAGILSIEYPLAPEVRYPENLEFACRAYDAMVEKLGICPGSVIIGGDSAGGAMAFHVTRHASDTRAKTGSVVPGVAGLVLVSPWVTHSCDTDSHELHVETDFIPGKVVLRDYSAAYADDHHNVLDNPAISPIQGDVDFLPPVMVTMGTREVFHNDIEEFVHKLRKEGKSVIAHEGPDCPHIYPVLWPLFRHEAALAIDAIADFCVERLRFCDTVQGDDLCDH